MQYAQTAKYFLNLFLPGIFYLATYHWPHIFYITFTYLQVSFARGNLISRGRPFRMVRVAISVLLATFGCCGLQSYISIKISSNALWIQPLKCNLDVFKNGYLTIEIEEENNMWRDLSSVLLCLEIPLRYLKAPYQSFFTCFFPSFVPLLPLSPL